MGLLRLLSPRGDDQVCWDVEAARAGDVEAALALQEAELLFEKERATGATAFRVISGKPVERLDAFDFEAEQIVVVPRVICPREARWVRIPGACASPLLPFARER